MENTMKQEKRERSVGFWKTRTGKRLIFYIIICALPVLQFCLFTLYVNFNSILLAFEKYVIVSKDNFGNATALTKQPAGFENFVDAWNLFVSKPHILVNSLWLFVANLCITIPLALIFSFYLYKKCMFSGVFRVILYLPNIISPLIFGLLFFQMVNNALPQYVSKLTAGAVQLPKMLDTANGVPKEAYGTILFFNIWVSFGVNVLMFTGAMSGIDESVVESAHLDGANIFQEFWFITVPMIFSTVSTFIVLTMTGVFNNQMNLVTFFGNKSEEILQTWGYYMYVTAAVSDYVQANGWASYVSYGVLAALGLIFTAIIAPITFGVRKLFDKFGPSEN